MDDKRPDPDRIADEAVGEVLESRRPDAGREAPRPAPTSAGPQANVAARTAESIGERAGDAYADATPDQAQGRSRKSVQQGRLVGSPRSGMARYLMIDGSQQFVTVIAAFALGYAAALLLHGRRTKGAKITGMDDDPAGSGLWGRMSSAPYSVFTRDRG